MELEERSEVRMGMRGCSFWLDLRGAQRELWNQRGEAPSHGHRAWDTERVQRDSSRARGAALMGYLRLSLQKLEPHRVKRDALDPFSGLAPSGLEEMPIILSWSLWSTEPGDIKPLDMVMDEALGQGSREGGRFIHSFNRFALSAYYVPGIQQWIKLPPPK